ncbi:MAG: hypothetical protein C5B53_00195 [Candidatus Melainabacteria bacterium]|nr:MAG: hypothetical protein C5B53_00195 [Candidatus Melainabacteria bacterium]
MANASQLLGSLRDLANQGPPPGMIKDLTRLTVERVMRDKILLGLVIVGLFGIFVGGFSGREERPAVKAVESHEAAQPTAAKTSVVAPTSSYAAGDPLDATLATDFVKWWVSGAMDYSANGSAKSHATAFHWMTPEAQSIFEANFWPNDLAAGIAQGQIVGAFQPVGVQAEAINPDGSVVVGLSGTLVLQSTGRPTTQQIFADILVRKEPSGLRVAGLYNRSGPPVSSTVY